MAPKFDFMKLPLVAQAHILANLDISEIFYFSLFSKRCKKIAVFARTKLEGNRMTINIDGGCVMINIHELDDIEYFVTDVEFYFDKTTVRKKTPWTIDGIKLEKKRGVDVFKVSSSNINKSIDAVLSHWFMIFPRCQVDMFCIGASERPDKIEFPKAFKAIQEIEKVELLWHDYSNKSKYLTSHINITKHFRDENAIKHRAVTGSGLKCTDCIMIYNAMWLTCENLLSLNCTQIELGSTRLREPDLLRFLRVWRNSNGEELERVRLLKIGHPADVGALDLTELGGQEWTPMDQHAVYQRNPTLLNFLMDSPFTPQGIDIVRADGRVGTVFHQLESPNPDTFTFVVWTDDFDFQDPNPIDE